jgi:hypothetical protein
MKKKDRHSVLKPSENDDCQEVRMGSAKIKNRKRDDNSFVVPHDASANASQL